MHNRNKRHKMSIKKLPHEVQCILRASCQINSFKKVVEELVFNALDAGSTSIAIRVNIQEGTIQVIDNGCGIRHSDIWSIGQRHMTSNYTDVLTLKTAPNKYGLRGEALANIIAVSRIVNIVSRLAEKEETWIKTFCNGREKKIAITSVRPSKGTTVEIKGFLYNINIRKNMINNIHELQNLRTFLEQLSLVHSNISLSLRDDAKNEIIFQIHKKRDIYQTVLSLFNMKENNILELSVEKNEYKVKGYIGKNDDIGKHWIYLNGKFVPSSSKLYKIVNENLAKSRSIGNKMKVKSKVNDDENNLFTNKIPFYFIFISCPYIDYDISHTLSNQSLLEFNDWNKINILLEKLIKFYIDGINLKPVKNPNNVNNKYRELNTRDQVKKIIEKVLGKKSDKPCISKMKNGIKGKLIKRKNKKKLPSISVSKIINAPMGNQALEEIITPFTKRTLNIQKNENINSNSKDKNSKTYNSKLNTSSTIKKKTIKIKQRDERHIRSNITEQKNKNKQKKNKECDKYKNPNVTNQKHFIKKLTDVKIHKRKKNTISSNSFTENSIIRKYPMSAKRVQQRPTPVRDEADKVLNKFITEQGSITMENKSISVSKNYDKIFTPNYYSGNLDTSVNYRIWKKPKGAPYRTTYDLVHTVLNDQVQDNFCWTRINNNLSLPDQSLYSPTHIKPGLIQYITPLELNHYKGHLQSENSISGMLPKDTQRNINVSNERSDIFSDIPRLTYESHCYQAKDFKEYSRYNDKKHNKKYRSITKKSIDTFNFNESYPKISHNHKLKPLTWTKIFDKNTMLSKLCHVKHCNAMSSYTLEFSGTVDHFNDRQDTTINDLNEDLKKYYSLNPGNNLTFIVPSKFKSSTSVCNTIIHEASGSNYLYKESENIEKINYNQQTSYDDSDIKSSLFNPIDSSIIVKNSEEVLNQKSCNIVFISNGQDTNKEENSLSETNFKDNDIDPLAVCKTVLSNVSISNEFNQSFSYKHLNESLFKGTNEVTKLLKTTEDNCNKKHLNEILLIESAQFVNEFIGSINKANESNNCSKHRLLNDVCPEQDDSYKKDQNFEKINNDCLEDVPIVNVEFDIRDRFKFLPKGMSQIFENCNTKTACDYNLDEDYFNDSIYDNFANDVQINTEIYEPVVQNLRETATKTIEKFSIKLVQDNASLKFNGQHLKDAKVLGQVDEKFIAAIIDGSYTCSDEIPKFLVLFDQHAVHERIRVEKNLADYFSNNQWASVPVEKLTLVLSKDEIISLHNYKEKFEQLGLQWTIFDNNSVKVETIPQAILGKRPRQFEKVIKAVKALIAEEVNMIKMQKGCISLYPKSIMNLVFSESCRYAIKFGDNLSKADCEELISNLSDCKTPFICAHGRPVMAAVTNYSSNSALGYKINPETLRRLKKFG